MKDFWPLVHNPFTTNFSINFQPPSSQSVTFLVSKPKCQSQECDIFGFETGFKTKMSFSADRTKQQSCQCPGAHSLPCASLVGRGGCLQLVLKMNSVSGVSKLPVKILGVDRLQHRTRLLS